MPMLIDGVKFYTIPEAAKEAGVTRNTMFRWVTRDVQRKSKSRIVRDVRSGHYLVSEDFVRENKATAGGRLRYVCA